ncbi:PDZ domain-containing protein [Novipirellula sp.]|uniref:PDZ domain-containing protein n=1 Tax=Novipirellula sp. TaxID=2795430 RepID=UPI003565CD62
MKTYPKSTLAWLIAGAVTVPLSGAAAISQETAETQKNTAPNTTAPAASSASSQVDPEEHIDRDSPALGVLVGSCPGQGVCVHDIVTGSPAERVGIERGDYILAINDKTVSTPKELKQVIEGLSAEDTVNVSVWRRGQKMTKQVALAAEAKTLPNSRQAWLGVALADRDNGESGVAIEQVHPNSPAQKAGLSPGDVVIQIDNTKVTSIDEFVEKVRDLEPGEKVNLTVQRDDEEQQIAVTLGQVGNAPLRWFRRPFGGPADQPFGSQPLDLGMPPLMHQGAPDVMEEMIDDMRAQIRSLQKEMDELKSQVAPQPRGDQPQNRDRDTKNNSEDDLSSNDFNPADFVQLVVQRDGRGHGHGDHDGHDHGNHGGGNQGNFQRPYNLPHLSNDWTGERYRYQDNRSYRYRVPYPPVYRYPSYYPYRYYQYGGRPYYYGGAYPYGYRGGVQIGPNFGIYW